MILAIKVSSIRLRPRLDFPGKGQRVPTVRGKGGGGALHRDHKTIYTKNKHDT